jgi:hypothetical protein
VIFIGEEFVANIASLNHLIAFASEVDGKLPSNVVVEVQSDRQALDCHYWFRSSGSVSQV